VEDGSHFVARTRLIQEILTWLDKYRCRSKSRRPTETPTNSGFNGDGFVKVVPYSLISRSVPLLSLSFTLPGVHGGEENEKSLGFHGVPCPLGGGPE